MSTTRTRILAIAVGAALLVSLGAAAPAEADRSPAFLLEGGDHWFPHPVGYPVVRGPAEIVVKGKRTIEGDLVANVYPDDSTLPAAGACESALASVWIETDGGETHISGAGDVCGLHVQEPNNVVRYAFTGDAYVESGEARNVYHKVGFLEIRLADNGRAHVFAVVQ